MSGPYSLKRGDFGSLITETLGESLADATVAFKMAPAPESDSELEPFSAEAEIVDAEKGEVAYTWQEGDTDYAGVYRAEWEVTFDSGAVVTYPADGWRDVLIRSDLDDLPPAGSAGGWQDATLAELDGDAIWTGTLRYRTEGDTVRLSGEVTPVLAVLEDALEDESVPLTTLPVGYRPDAETIIIIASSSGTALGFLIGADGVVEQHPYTFALGMDVWPAGDFLVNATFSLT